MIEPTIDEMLEFLQDAEINAKAYPPTVLWSDSDRILPAIRAKLERYRQIQESPMGQHLLVDAIRAFVERVEKRIDHLAPDFTYITAMYDELAAMEGENE